MAAPMNRIAYFVPVKNKEGLAVGVLSDEQFEMLLRVAEEAKSQGKRPVFFLWRNEPDPERGRKSIATLTMAVERDRPQFQQNTGRRPIGNTSAPPDPMKTLFGSGSGNAKQTQQKGW